MALCKSRRPLPLTLSMFVFSPDLAGMSFRATLFANRKLSTLSEICEVLMITADWADFDDLNKGLDGSNIKYRLRICSLPLTDDSILERNKQTSWALTQHKVQENRSTLFHPLLKSATSMCMNPPTLPVLIVTLCHIFFSLLCREHLLSWADWKSKWDFGLARSRIETVASKSKYLREEFPLSLSVPVTSFSSSLPSPS